MRFSPRYMHYCCASQVQGLSMRGMAPIGRMRPITLIALIGLGIEC